MQMDDSGKKQNVPAHVFFSFFLLRFDICLFNVISSKKIDTKWAILFSESLWKSGIHIKYYF